MVWWLLPLALVIIVVWLFLRQRKAKTAGDRMIFGYGEVPLAGEVVEAWMSQDLDSMLVVLDKKTHPVNRHRLLSGIVGKTYPRRNESAEMRATCERIARLHLRELPKLAEALIRSDKASGGSGELPFFPTFHYLARLLAEKGEYDQAITVCNEGLSFTPREAISLTVVKHLIEKQREAAEAKPREE